MDLYFTKTGLLGSNAEIIFFNVEYEWVSDGDNGTLIATPHNFKCNSRAMMLSDFNAYDREIIDLEVERERAYRDYQYGERYIAAAQDARDQELIDISREK